MEEGFRAHKGRETELVLPPALSLEDPITDTQEQNQILPSTLDDTQRCLMTREKHNAESLLHSFILTRGFRCSLRVKGLTNPKLCSVDVYINLIEARFIFACLSDSREYLRYASKPGPPVEMYKKIH